ncbi:hypothetical protein BOX37_13870 [Nocardia mangyaensis]|uniref:Uncharacterized protein n=1 Tax=Nocardia mangyaensis TaxID=2213200 RepID=A0A1J0VSD4_9NOCA|nr:hypothetical protein [Nocardia mangyaensis]APE34855.1 hypothetical protein BOX37_13870 [Nocardia mangyaensis]
MIQQNRDALYPVAIGAGPQREFEYPDYDSGSHQQVREALLVLGKTMNGFTKSFGTGRGEPISPRERFRKTNPSDRESALDLIRRQGP